MTLPERANGFELTASKGVVTIGERITFTLTNTETIRGGSEKNTNTIFSGSTTGGNRSTLQRAKPVGDWRHGEQHNVVALDGTFDSGRTNAQRGTSYHYIFEEPGEYRFVSERPHNRRRS